jgi:hypothetical protein
MTRTATFSALAAAALLVGACSTTPPESDTTIISHCDNNKVSTGGYWWTYRDRANGVGAEIVPLTDLNTSFPMVDCDLKGKCAHVTGHVRGGPLDVSAGTDLCGEAIYPAAGLGFGFKPNNPPFTLPDKATGISFFAKAVPNAPDPTYTLRAAMPQTTTDYPQAEFSDKFTRSCKCTNEVTAPEKKSCFANYMNDQAIKLPNTWQLCSIYFKDLAAPSWGQDVGWDPTKIIKFQLDMEQPGSLDADVAFDVSADEFRWIIPGDKNTQPGIPGDPVLGTGSGCVDVAASGIVPL